MVPEVQLSALRLLDTTLTFTNRKYTVQHLPSDFSYKLFLCVVHLFQLLKLLECVHCLYCIKYNSFLTWLFGW